MTTQFGTATMNKRSPPSEPSLIDDPSAKKPKATVDEDSLLIDDDLTYVYETIDTAPKTQKS